MTNLIIKIQKTWDNYQANSPHVYLTYKNGKIGLSINIPHSSGSLVISECAIIKG